jgi:hypothetical protein
MPRSRRSKAKAIARKDPAEIAHELLGYIFEVLDCTPLVDDPKAFVERGGLRHLEREAMRNARNLVRIWAYPQMVGYLTPRRIRMSPNPLPVI